MATVAHLASGCSCPAHQCRRATLDTVFLPLQTLPGTLGTKALHQSLSGLGMVCKLTPVEMPSLSLSSWCHTLTWGQQPRPPAGCHFIAILLSMLVMGVFVVTVFVTSPCVLRILEQPASTEQGWPLPPFPATPAQPLGHQVPPQGRLHFSQISVS